MAATPSYTLRGPVGVVIAHPDDESMFFAPALTTLQRRGERTFLLCLSTGDFYGLGQTRKRELVKACNVLGVKEDDILIVDHPDLQDGSDKPWPPQLVASKVEDFVQKYGINTLLTFDELGVSGHSNHAAVNTGVALFLQIRTISSSRAVDAFALATTGTIRKYLGLLDMPWSFVTSYAPPLGSFFASFSPRTAWKAMSAHRSQFVWYRRLFVIFSRYVYVNTFKRMQSHPCE